MLFKELKINDKFTVATYPNSYFLRVKDFPGSCCTKPHNCKIITGNQEKVVKLDDNTEVELKCD